MLLRRLLAATVGAGAAITTLLVPASSAAAAETYPVPASGSWTITGRAFGHGYGLSQWGAQSRAVAGQDYRRILADYYPGTAIGRRDDRMLRVQLSRLQGNEVFLETRSAAPLTVGNRSVPQGQRLRVTWDGSALLLTAFAPGWQQVWSERYTSIPTITGADGVWVERLDGSGNRYSGSISFPLAAPVMPVNNVRLETYLLGVVPRESPGWFAPQALQAQAVAARSYALATLKPANSPYDICDTEACQVYLGTEGRTAAGALTDLQPASTTAAVRATAGEIREYQGEAAFTQFSSSNGGWSAAGSKPYLRAAEDYWSSPQGAVSQDTVAAWTLQLPVSAVARNCPAGGAPLAMTITARDGNGVWGGRITGLTVRCTTGDASVSVSGARFGTLRSNWWTVVPGGSAEVSAKWSALGGDGGVLGRPASPIYALPQVEGTYQLFERGSVYWSPAAGAHAIRGAIRDRWGRLGYENSALGFPTTDEGPLATRGGVGQQFLGGSLYWSPASGAHEVRGAIRAKWTQLGWEAGFLGYPLTDEVRLRAGAYSVFQGGSVYWSSSTGAHEVRGSIRDAWGRAGWENGRLGYPTSDEFAEGAGRRSNFQGGYITWTPAGGPVVHLS